GEIFTRSSEAQQHRDDVPMIGSALPFDETEGAYGEALGLDRPAALAEVGGDVQKPADFFHPMPVLDAFRKQVLSSPCPRQEQLRYLHWRRACGAKRSCRMTGIPKENLLRGGDQGRRQGR